MTVFCADSLKVNYFTAPLGVDDPTPRFFWRMNDSRAGAFQSAYQILVTNGDATVWDSGKTISGESIQIVYAGQPLEPRTCYGWQVRIWDHQGVDSQWAHSRFETGLMNTPWQGKWISWTIAQEPLFPIPFFRKEFSIDKPVRRARLYATALGVYEAHINGQRVGNDYFSPGWTSYAKRVQYHTYDVTELLTEGQNALGSLLGGGWYHGYICGAYANRFASMGTQPALCLQLAIDYTDGSADIIATDTSWKFSSGHIAYSDIYMGEKQELDKFPRGWDRAGFNDSAWSDAIPSVEKIPAVEAPRGPAVRQMHSLRPKAITQPQPGVYIADMGQNMVGWARLRVTAAAGTTITLRHGERLNPDGTLYTTNLRSAKAIAYYTLSDSTETVLEPNFTFFGFQYLEITGLDTAPSLDTIEGVVLYTEMEQTGSFACSNPLVNQLVSNIVWGQRGNYLDVPTDCPQRDERLGWTGDAQVFIRTASYLTDIAGFFTKWLVDLTDSQHEDGRGPEVAPLITLEHHSSLSAWADAFVICPLAIYKAYGDTTVLAQHYAAIKKYLLWQKSVSPQWLRDGGWTGDWLHINDHTPTLVLGTAFFAATARMAAHIADILGKTGDREEFTLWANTIATRFNDEFVTPSARIIGDSQTAYILALHFDLLPEQKRAAAADHLVRRIGENKGKLSCGFVGSPYINHVLTRFGHLDTAYQLLNNTEWPSWLYAVTKGATTIWERWNGWTEEQGFADPGMNSFNHYAYGAIGDWLYSTVAGIAWGDTSAGYKAFRLAPQPGGELTNVDATYDSIYGSICSSWQRSADATEFRFTVPANTSALIVLPTENAGAITVLAGKDHLGSATPVDGAIGFSAPAGEYAFRITH